MNKIETRTGYNEVPQGVAGVSWVNILLGIWVILSPFVLGFGQHSMARWSNVANWSDEKGSKPIPSAR